MRLVTRPVKRQYDTTGRRAQSAETRRRIVEAARLLLLCDGYRATTVAAVARQAGVNADTVYALVGPKPALLRELIEQAISGVGQAVDANERDYVRQIRAADDATDKLRIYAGAVRRIMERLGPLFTAIAEAAPSEPEIGELWRTVAERRAANMRLFVADVRGARSLRRGLTLERAADTVWALNGPEMFLLLTRDRGWTPAQYERWLADTWSRLLFD